ncbi:MAG: hypothetical protein SynsKO_42400 [Synoicihabitans sp.]
MLLLATTTLEKLQAVPTRFWINAAIFILGGWLTIMLLRHAARMNKMVLTMIIVVSVTTVGFQWIWERNEPRFLTPYINIVAPLFPSKNTF